MAPHSSTLAWKIPWMEEPGRLQSMGLLRVRHDWVTSLSLFHFHALEKEMETYSSVLAWRIPGMAEPGGLLSIGLHRVRHDWSDLAAAAAATPILMKTLKKLQRMEHAHTHSTKPPSPWYQNQTKTTHKKRKLQTIIPDEHRCKNLSKNFFAKKF